MSVPATSLAYVVAEIAKPYTNLPNNSLIDMEIVSAIALTDTAGAEHLTIQSAAFGLLASGNYPPSAGVSGTAITLPAFSGAPLGLVNYASFQGRFAAWSDELLLVDADYLSPKAAILVLSVYNGDSSAHDVNSLSLSARIRIKTFDEPNYE